MNNVNAVYDGGYEEWNDEFFELQDLIYDDFNRFSYYISDMEESVERECLLEKIDFIKRSIPENRFLEEYRLDIMFTDKYLLFSYFPINEKGDIILGEPSNKVIMSKNLKKLEFYFLNSEEGVFFAEYFKVQNGKVEMFQTVMEEDEVDNIFEENDNFVVKLKREFNLDQWENSMIKLEWDLKDLFKSDEEFYSEIEIVKELLNEIKTYEEKEIDCNSFCFTREKFGY